MVGGESLVIRLGWCTLIKNRFAIGAERSIVEALRPHPGQEVTGAIFSTYSVDLVAVLAILLGLSSIDATEVEADATDLHRALFRVGKRMLILCQRGRVRSPRSYRRARILAALDRTLVEVPFDERNRSWHAKLALVAYKSKVVAQTADITEWRLWLGSRNLTRSTDLDFGLMMVGYSSPNGGKAEHGGDIPGLSSALVSILGSGGHRVRDVLATMLALPRQAQPRHTVPTLPCLVNQI